MSSTVPPIKACLFDMDGLLINTEDMYTAVTNTVLSRYGRAGLPWSIKAQLQGRPYPQASAVFHAWAKLPISREEYAKQVADLQLEYFPHSAPLPGVPRLLSTLAATATTEHPVHIALATSSTSRNYHLKTDHLQSLFSLFPPTRRVVGDDPRIGVGRGKPLPDIYLLALETINSELRAEGKEEVRPEECLVFEDSVSGVEAGRRAGMQVVWVPMAGLLNEYKGQEDTVLAGRLGGYTDGELPAVENPEDWRRSSPGQVGEINDGFARLLMTLEDFPYESYGIHVPEVPLKN